MHVIALNIMKLIKKIAFQQAKNRLNQKLNKKTSLSRAFPDKPDFSFTFSAMQDVSVNPVCHNGTRLKRVCPTSPQ